LRDTETSTNSTTTDNMQLLLIKLTCSVNEDETSKEHSHLTVPPQTLITNHFVYKCSSSSVQSRYKAHKYATFH